MKLDILYLAKGRRLYTSQSFKALLHNTDWSLVNRLIVYDDGSPARDNSKLVLSRLLPEVPVASEFFQTKFGSPVGVMNDYLTMVCDAEVFAKIDNDIMLPPEWLNVMADTLERNKGVHLLGMQADMSGPPTPEWDGRYSIRRSSHIGGVGLMRVSAFKSYGLPVPDGYFGFTEWQHTNQPGRGWITPDIKMFGLDLLPFEPWRTTAKKYVSDGIQRHWPPYTVDMDFYWDWWDRERR